MNRLYIRTKQLQMRQKGYLKKYLINVCTFGIQRKLYCSSKSIQYLHHQRGILFLPNRSAFAPKSKTTLPSQPALSTEFLVFPQLKTRQQPKLNTTLM